MYLFGRIMYWIGAFCTMFPLFLMDLPFWILLLSFFIIVFLQFMFPVVSTVVQSILWIIGIVYLFTNPFAVHVYIIAFIAFAYWLSMQIYYYNKFRVTK